MRGSLTDTAKHVAGESIAVDGSELLKVSKNKMARPDGVGPRGLCTCVEQLYMILCCIFNFYLPQCKVPQKQ